MKTIQLQQVSKMLMQAWDIPTIPKRWWIYTLRNSLGMTITTAAKRANISTTAWWMTEQREVDGKVTIATMERFFKVLWANFTYIPQIPLSLESTVKNQVLEYVQKEMQRVNSTMTLEDQKTTSDFSEKRIQEQVIDIYRSGNWREIWK